MGEVVDEKFNRFLIHVRLLFAEIECTMVKLAKSISHVGGMVVLLSWATDFIGLNYLSPPPSCAEK